MPEVIEYVAEIAPPYRRIECGFAIGAHDAEGLVKNTPSDGMRLSPHERIGEGQLGNGRRVLRKPGVEYTLVRYLDILEIRKCRQCVFNNAHHDYNISKKLSDADSLAETKPIYLSKSITILMACLFSIRSNAFLISPIGST